MSRYPLNYPSWGPSWTRGMPLILSPAVGKVVHDLAVVSSLDVTEVMEALTGVWTSFRSRVQDEGPTKGPTQ